MENKERFWLEELVTNRIMEMTLEYTTQKEQGKMKKWVEVWIIGIDCGMDGIDRQFEPFMVARLMSEWMAKELLKNYKEGTAEMRSAETGLKMVKS